MDYIRALNNFYNTKFIFEKQLAFLTRAMHCDFQLDSDSHVWFCRGGEMIDPYVECAKLNHCKEVIVDEKA